MMTTGITTIDYGTYNYSCCSKPYWQVDNNVSICRNCGATKAIAVATPWTYPYQPPYINTSPLCQTVTAVGNGPVAGYHFKMAAQNSCQTSGVVGSRVAA